MQSWPEAKNYVLHVLPLEERPQQTSSITQALETARSQFLTELGLETASDRPLIIVIPRLDIYFCAVLAAGRQLSSCET
ncbi:MAG: hypothetical protein HC886_14635 [Leptolyngbyaceae cyanobacterium SM1_1_3]|nr:hypothetical protein [Leptolyngbyaceae cyanobacterium SM1_1_3]